MGAVTSQLSISWTASRAGANQSLDDPLAEGGLRPHKWVFNSASWREQHVLEGGEHDED